MFEGMLQTITQPKPFFERLREDDALVSRAIWVVLLISVVSAGAGYFSSLPTASVMGENSLLGSVTIYAAAFGFVIVTFMTWLITGLLVRITAGIDVKPWAIVGYALSPYLLVYVLFMVLAAVFPVTLPELNVSPDDPAAFGAALEEAQTLYAQSIYARLTQGLSYLVTLWWVVLIFIGVDAAAGRNKAFLTAGIVGLVNLAFIALPFLLQPV